MAAPVVTVLPARVPRRPLVLAVLCTSLLLVSLDNTILNVALPDVVRELGATSSQLQWIVDAYVVVFAGTLLVLGSLGDRLGRKWLFLAGLAVFGAASAASAFSQSAGALVAARAVMGIGAAAIMPSTLSILTNVFPRPDESAKAIGIWSGTTGLGVAVGPVVGGWLLAHFWWGSVFLVNVPLAAVGLLAALVVVPNSRDPASRPPDFIGAPLSVAGMALLLWGIIEAPMRSWASPAILASLAASVALLAVFALFERRSTHPMLNVVVFRSRRFSVAMAAMATVIFALFGALFVLTQYLQFSLGYSALQTGLRIVPIAGLLLVAAPTSTLLVRVFGTKLVVAAGMSLIAVGLVLVSRVSPAGTYGDAFPALCLIGAGAGLSFAPCTDAVMGSLPPARTGVGAATNSAAIQTGGALGVAVLGSLLNTRYVDHLRPALAGHRMPVDVESLITGSLGGALEVARRTGGALGAGLAAVARDSFVSGMDLALLVGGIVVAGGVVLVLVALPSRPAGARQPQRARPERQRRRASGRRRASAGGEVAPLRRTSTRTSALAQWSGKLLRRAARSVRADAHVHQHGREPAPPARPGLR